MWLLTARFGLTSAFLQQGTDLSQLGQTGSTANIYKYFGLVWDATTERWNYIGHPNSPSVTSPLATSIATFGVGGTQSATRELDFFELLQAGIDNNSLGDAFSSDPGLPLAHQQSKMLHILTIGANLIAQSRADSYPVRIACKVNVAGNPTTMEAVGMPRLPFISSMALCPVGVTDTVAGGMNWLLIPNLWDPFRDNWDLTEANVSSTLTPGYPRPPVRITMRGSTFFGYANSIVTQSGSVNPDGASVTLFPTASTGGTQSLLLTTGDSTFGRDGFREAMRLGTSDISTSVTAFDPTTLGSSVPSWNSVVRPANDGSNYRNDGFVVIRISLAGTSITTPDAIGKNPVLTAPAGVQLSLDYQSPSGQWYPYSFLQGNIATNTWISSDPPDPSNPSNLSLATSFSQYGLPATYQNPTVVNSTDTSTATLWTSAAGGVAALAQAPMLAKADPRSVRYNSMIGVVNLANPPLPFTSAGIIGSIWPGPYATPPPMSASAFPTPTPTPNPNPATLGDNALVPNNASNPYSETSGDAWRPVMMNRPFRSVGEMGYAFRDQPFRTLSFSSGTSSNPSPDAALLDLFSVNDYSAPSSMRAGTINLNSQQPAALAAVLGSTIKREDTPRGGSPPAPTPQLLTVAEANNTAASLASLSSTAPVTNKAGVATFIANVTDSTGLGPSQPKTQRESIARALGEVGQTRTWNLLIDVIAQTGHFKPNANSLQNDFIVEGEEHYWLHVAIDRFTGQVIDKQTEVVKE